MKRSKQLPKLGFRSASKDQKHATCRRFICGVTALPEEKRGMIPLPELLRDLAEAESAMTRVAGLRAALKAAEIMSDEKTAKLCQKVTSGVELIFSDPDPSMVVFQAALVSETSKKTASSPGVPTDLRATAAHGGVELRWKSPRRQSVFAVEFTEDPGGQAGWIRDAKNVTTRASHFLTGLKPNTAYSFRVRVENPHGEGPWSESVTARPL
jgi:hypothetical protein